MKSKRRPILPCDLRDVNPQSLFRAKKEKRADASMISLSLGVRMKDKRAGKKNVPQSDANAVQNKYKQQRGLTANVTQAVNSQ
jgi:hypothetical protein